MPLTAALAIALALVGHNASQGKSSFVVADDGHVDVTVHLLELDLPELCEVDFGVADAQKKQAMEQKLDRCVSDGLAQWLRVRLDGASCPITGARVRRGPGLDVVVEGFATCPQHVADGRTLILDWGLFAWSSLDHQSTATVTLPDGSKTLALLSRRKNKLVVELPSHRGVVAAVAVATVAFFVVVAGLLLVRRRGHRRPRLPVTETRRRA